MDKDELFARAVELGLNPDKRWSEARLVKEIESAETASAPSVEISPEIEPKPVVETEAPALADYIAFAQERHIDRDVVLVSVSHPGAEEHIYPGTYSGIRVTRGPLGLRYSDGTNE